MLRSTTHYLPTIPLVLVVCLLWPALAWGTSHSLDLNQKPDGGPYPPILADALVPLLGFASEGSETAAKSVIPAAPICALAQCDAKVYCSRQPNSACLLQTFKEIQWRICIHATRFGTASQQHSKGLGIGPVYMRNMVETGAPWRKILHEASLAELFTPYHERVGARYYDTQYLTWDSWQRTVTQDDAGREGALVTLAEDGDFGPTVVAECRDRGPAWLCKEDFEATIRRGQELALWGILETGNYDFITEYAFLDDGTIRMRVGATGYNDPHSPDEAHSHDALWRIDIDLDGARGDTAYLVRHVEPDPASPSPLLAVDEHVLFNGGIEGAAAWDPLAFASLLVEDQGVNALGNHRGYEIEPLRSGSARHFGGNEVWTTKDFWVTRYSRISTTWADNWSPPDTYLLPDIAEKQSLQNNDLVLWYFASAHHDPTDEDRENDPGVFGYGVTRTHWFGFELAPHDFFDYNPLGGPKRCGP